MKRMSEVLNIRVVKNAFYDATNDSWICAFVDEDKAQHAAHSIDHVDALADALGDIVFDYFATINLSNVDMASLNPELHKKMTVATDALAAYRGDK